MELVILRCGGNELARIGLESEELKLDGSDKAHNHLLARLIKEEIIKAGYGSWEITGEQVAEMLKNKKKEDDTITITLPNLCPCHNCWITE